MISSQVAQAFAWTIRRKLGFSADESGRILNTYRVFRFVPIEMRLVENALATAEANRISFWGALIVEAAVEARCKVLFSADLNHGHEIRGVKILNPFIS